jgi:hypothetical protein
LIASPAPLDPTLAEAREAVKGRVDDLRAFAQRRRQMALGLAPDGSQEQAPPADAGRLIAEAEAQEREAEVFHKAERVVEAVEQNDKLVSAVVITRRAGVGADTILAALKRLQSDAKANRAAHAQGRGA